MLQRLFRIFISLTYFMRYLSFSACLIFAFLIGQNLSAQSANIKPRATIDHLALFVVDLQKEKSFYSDVIQLDSLAEPFHDGKHAWFTIGAGIALHIIQGAPQTKEYYKNNHM